MKHLWISVFILALAGCDNMTITTGSSISSEELEQFFQKHRIDGNRAVAIKKRSFANSYLGTIHGYPTNMSVCEDLIAPYNKDSSLSGVPGEYYCEELR